MTPSSRPRSSRCVAGAGRKAGGSILVNDSTASSARPPSRPRRVPAASPRVPRKQGQACARPRVRNRRRRPRGAPRGRRHPVRSAVDRRRQSSSSTTHATPCSPGPARAPSGSKSSVCCVVSDCGAGMRSGRRWRARCSCGRRTSSPRSAPRRCAPSSGSRLTRRTAWCPSACTTSSASTPPSTDVSRVHGVDTPLPRIVCAPRIRSG